ncbi:MAG: hypothetical protein KGM98_09655, partial [Bacteroidota bacterium]|nr:hypothetical protein [Bacteroidota bacterium]
YLGAFTANRWGMLIDRDGGGLVHTPVYDYRVNQKVTHMVAALDDQGNLSGSVSTAYHAETGDDLSLILASYSSKDATDFIRKSIDLPTYDIQQLHFTQHPSKLPSVTADFQLTASSYAQVSGRRIFILPDILTRSGIRLLPDSARHYGISIQKSFTEIDSAEIQIPEGYSVELPFKDQNLQSPFGTYYVHATITPGKILFYRKREVFSGDFPASDYAAMVTYYDQVYKSDHSRVVLVKPE